MKKVMDKVFPIIGIILFLIALILDAIWIYYKFFAPESYKETTIYANEVEDTNGKKSVCEVVCYDNADGTGVQLLDIKLNFYSDYNATNVIANGIQVIGGVSNLKYSTPLKVKSIFPFKGYSYLNYLEGDIGVENYKNNKICFYEGSDNLDYAGINNKFDNFGSIKIEVNNKIYALELGQNYLNVDGAFGSTGEVISSLSLFIKKLEEVVSKLPVGHSEKTIKFEDYFKIFEFDKDKGKFVNITEDIDKVTSYFYIDFTHYSTGAKTAQDSLFKQIQYDVNYVVKESNMLDEHFSDKAIYYLSYNDLSFSYDEEKKCHLLDITQSCFNKYENKKLNLTIEIDVDYLKTIEIAYCGVKENSLIKQIGINSIYVIENGIKSEVTV